jgi:hypothetical protein
MPKKKYSRSQSRGKKGGALTKKKNKKEKDHQHSAMHDIFLHSQSRNHKCNAMAFSHGTFEPVVHNGHIDLILHLPNEAAHDAHKHKRTGRLKH